MNRLPKAKRIQVVAALVEGNSIRSTVRMTGVAKNTVTKLLVDLGTVCSIFQDRTLRKLPCRRVQTDEIWSFCYAKQKNVPADKQGQFGYGDVWTWTAICADTKLVISWLVGGRDAGFGSVFMRDVASRLANRVQLTTADGHSAYFQAVEDAFGGDVDYAMLVKIYGNDPQGEVRYSPAVCTGCKRTSVAGIPDFDHVSTSFAEQQNLTMRMRIRLMTRLTNAFSKKVENLEHAVALHFMHYNFCRRHQTLRVTPAMAAGVADHVWSLEELIGLLDQESAN